LISLIKLFQTGKTKLVDKNKFSNLIQHPQSLSDVDLADLNEIIKNHAYCQIPYFLIAKHYYQNNLPEKDKHIHKASAYTLDRKILKKFITTPFTIQEQQEESPTSDEENTVTEEQGNNLSENSFEKSTDQNSAESENISAKEELQELTETTEIQINKSETSEELTREAKQSIIEVDHTSNDDISLDKNSKEDHEEHTSETVENGIVEIDTNAVSEDKNTSKENKKAFVSQGLSEEKAHKIEEPDDSFILGYLNNLKSDTDQTPNYRRKHQDDLIERFIKSRPSLSRPSSTVEKENAEDLSEPSITIDANLISENLAIIMVKQGKVEKAIDIYKKLIWKYPQKKAYFANRIQELKK